MNRTALQVVTAIAVVSLAGQAFAHGGSTGAGNMTSRMTTAQPAVGGGSMHQQTAAQQGGTMQGGTMQSGMASTPGVVNSGIGNQSGHHAGTPATVDQPAGNR